MKPVKELSLKVFEALGERPKNPWKELRKRIRNGSIKYERLDERTGIFSDAQGPFLKFLYLPGAPKEFTLLGTDDGAH